MDFSQVDDYMKLYEKQNNIQSVTKQIEELFTSSKLKKKQTIKYETINILSENIAGENVDNIELGKLNINLYEKGLINFEHNSMFVIIYIPSYNSEIEYKYNNRFKNPIFQLFQSIYLNEYNYLDDPFKSQVYDYIEILKFEDTVQLQTVVKKTINYIKYSIKSRVKILEIEINKKIKEQVFEDTYLQNEIVFHKVLEEKYDLITQSENIYCFDLITTLAIEIDTEGLFIKNINLENIEVEYKNSKIREIIEEFSSDVPGINITKKYIANEDLYFVLLTECETDIDYITEYIKLFCNNKNYIDCREILNLLENKKIIIEDKMVEREEMEEMYNENKKEYEILVNDVFE